MRISNLSLSGMPSMGQRFPPLGDQREGWRRTSLMCMVGTSQPSSSAALSVDSHPSSGTEGGVGVEVQGCGGASGSWAVAGAEELLSSCEGGDASVREVWRLLRRGLGIGMGGERGMLPPSTLPAESSIPDSDSGQVETGGSDAVGGHDTSAVVEGGSKGEGWAGRSGQTTPGMVPLARR